MKNDRRDFIKKTASLAAAVSIGGINSSIANTYKIKEKRTVYCWPG